MQMMVLNLFSGEDIQMHNSILQGSCELMQWIAVGSYTYGGRADTLKDQGAKEETTKDSKGQGFPRICAKDQEDEFKIPERPSRKTS